MRIICIFLFFSNIIFTQNTTNVIEGTLLDSEGNPISYKTIYAKEGNSIKYFDTDEEGNYKIPYCKNCELYYYDIFTGNKININISKYTTVVLPIYSEDYQAGLPKIDSIKPPFNKQKITKENFNNLTYFDKGLLIENDSIVKIKSHDDYFKINLDFYSQIIVSTPIRLYDYQKTYSQGRSIGGKITYQAPETNEIFSFGPSIDIGLTIMETC